MKVSSFSIFLTAMTAKWLSPAVGQAAAGDMIPSEHETQELINLVNSAKAGETNSEEFEQIGSSFPSHEFLEHLKANQAMGESARSPNL
ncbi:hypothetical protein BESB_031160 [Besnoitia besnoiti]|uniref:Uncharacterized protein n=1 Tax=Besnoitia besnoiti TaxID=94643 RepID=A0A2A9M790_BESBE|nr:hypothetical protein BESB_031160 [Besnoitia besnoiti]PFH31242.1 hypothetical protein BESB_031160 [Besnoitia besnoiti]